MRLCAVGDVLLPEGLQPQGGGEWVRMRVPIANIQRQPRRWLAERMGKAIAGTVSPHCCSFRTGRMVD
jgi:hypothetical protein